MFNQWSPLENSEIQHQTKGVWQQLKLEANGPSQSFLGTPHLVQNNVSHDQVKDTIRKKPEKQKRQQKLSTQYAFISKTTCSFSLVHSVFLTEVKFFSGIQGRFMTEKEQILPGSGCVQAVELLGHVADFWAACRHPFFSLNPLEVVRELPLFLFTWRKVAASTNNMKVLVPPEY
ncbi:hypothetical protein P7K49_004596 [Saguinus oedipus]|uniref:Uncharacterized protein n=1 Tax=Saguinus oedipus TaxID=9490 RepID=A0ABQ9W7V6_SAGOE|nr:hypothetical protein P7K49_004596 [Saguinus oedipus]